MVPRILFALPSRGGGGGPNSVVQESLGLASMGVPVRIAIDALNYIDFAASYPELHSDAIDLRSYSNPTDLSDAMKGVDIAVATTNRSVYDVEEAHKRLSPDVRVKTRIAYYVQDYEPLFYKPRSDAWQKAVASYSRIPDAVLFAKTDWICNTVYANHGIQVARVQASIDHSIFYPDFRREEAEMSILAMVRPKTPRRAPVRTMRIMEILASSMKRVQLRVFGCDSEELSDLSFLISPSIEVVGQRRRTEVPDLMRRADLFLDLSDYQAFGRASLEGMACGCIPVVPLLGGGSEFAVHGKNSFVVDTRSDDEIVEAIGMFAEMSAPARLEMRLAALGTAAHYSIKTAALSELQLFSNMLAAQE